jgi:CDP-diacylglycerol--serine O-phosphatidyltransferase
MKGMSLRERLVDPRSPDRRPRRAAYALPTLFTSANVFLGFYALLEVFQGALQMAEHAPGGHTHFRFAAMAIAAAVFFDGLDGRIARMTNTVSDFGRELDSLADVITFGIAPAAMVFVWGVYFVQPGDPLMLENLRRAGYFVSFLFLLCGACRLARFNIQKNPVPKNPGRPDRKYFVGLPIPAAAGAIAAIVYASDGVPLAGLPLDNWVVSASWLVLVGMLAILMVSTWRYPSFKDLTLTRPRSPLTFVLLASVIYLTFIFSRPVLLAAAAAYVLSGIVIRLGGIVRRRVKPVPGEPEHQVG